MKDRILMVSPTSFLGGAERSLLELCSGLSARGEFVPLLIAPAGGGIHAAACNVGIESQHLGTVKLEPWERRPSFVGLANELMRAAVEIRRVAKAKNVRAIHANGLKSAVPSVLAARSLRIPCIWHVRDFPRKTRLHRFLSKFVPRILAPSPFIASALVQECGIAPGLIRVIPNGVSAPSLDLSRIPEFRKEIGVGSDTTVVTVIAQIVPWKRHDLLLKAASILVHEDPDLRFLIVGKDPWGAHGAYYEDLVRLASESRLDERVAFLGQREDVGTILAASDVVVLPSEREPFGRVVVEAFWSGTPIVVSDDGAPADLVTDGETGLHFRSGDAEDLASKIHRVLSNRALGAELSRRGKQEADKYDVELHADRVAEAYGELLL